MHCRVVVGIGGSALLILLFLAACCGCMIPSEDCCQRLGLCITLTRARCWCDCCAWRRKQEDWVDPEIPPPQHEGKPVKPSGLSKPTCVKVPRIGPAKKLAAIEEESPKGTSYSHISLPFSCSKLHPQNFNWSVLADLTNSYNCPCPPDRKSTRLNSSHSGESRMPSSA